MFELLLNQQPKTVLLLLLLLLLLLPPDPLTAESQTASVVRCGRNGCVHIETRHTQMKRKDRERESRKEMMRTEGMKSCSKHETTQLLEVTRLESMSYRRKMKTVGLSCTLPIQLLQCGQCRCYVIHSFFHSFI